MSILEVDLVNVSIKPVNRDKSLLFYHALLGLYRSKYLLITLVSIGVITIYNVDTLTTDC